MKQKLLILVILGLGLGLVTAWAAQEQSLGDLARHVREQREKEAKKPVKVFTNDDLPPRPAGEGPSVSSGLSEAPPSPDSSNAANPAGANAPSANEKAASSRPEVKDQEYWQGRFKALRADLSAAKEPQNLAEDELNLLQIQAARELDPTAKSDLEAKIKDKQAEVDAKKAATDKVQKQLDELEKQFKDSGAPEEWSKTE